MALYRSEVSYPRYRTKGMWIVALLIDASMCAMALRFCGGFMGRGSWLGWIILAMPAFMMLRLLLNLISRVQITQEQIRLTVLGIPTWRRELQHIRSVLRLEACYSTGQSLHFVGITTLTGEEIRRQGTEYLETNPRCNRLEECDRETGWFLAGIKKHFSQSTFADPKREILWLEDGSEVADVLMQHCFCAQRYDHTIHIPHETRNHHHY